MKVYTAILCTALVFTIVAVQSVNSRPISYNGPAGQGNDVANVVSAAENCPPHLEAKAKLVKRTEDKRETAFSHAQISALADSLDKADTAHLPRAQEQQAEAEDDDNRKKGPAEDEADFEEMLDLLAIVLMGISKYMLIVIVGLLKIMIIAIECLIKLVLIAMMGLIKILVSAMVIAIECFIRLVLIAMMGLMKLLARAIAGLMKLLARAIAGLMALRRRHGGPEEAP